MIAIIITTIGRITAIQVCIIFRTHTASASPAFITYPKEFHFPWFFTTVLLTQFRHRATLFGSHVFHPFRHFFHTPTSYITTDIRLTTYQLTQVQKFMCSETIIFYCTSPVIIDHPGTILFRADTIHPMIFIGKTPPRPTKHRHFQVLQSLKHIITIALGIGNFRIFTYPQTSIDTSSQMLCKLSINMFTDDFFPLLGMYIDSRFLLSKYRHCSEQCQAHKCIFHD